MAPFNAMNAADWANQQIQILLTTLAADTQQGISDPATQNAILAWMADPFDPHMVASTRISAYGKATVMKFLDNLIAWGDSLYAQYTAETVSQAEQLYILADMILGPGPISCAAPTSQRTIADLRIAAKPRPVLQHPGERRERHRGARAAAIGRPGHRRHCRHLPYAAVLHSAQRSASELLGQGGTAALQYSPLPEPAGRGAAAARFTRRRSIRCS